MRTISGRKPFNSVISSAVGSYIYRILNLFVLFAGAYYELISLFLRN